MKKFDLPPLSCLPAFEAAARYKSFTKAADELCVTQAAVSFQVRNLEKALGVNLFIRRHRRLDLTAKGHALMVVVQASFAALAEEKAKITGIVPTGSVTITAPISFSGKWLVPRLRRLYAAVPNISLRIDANDSVVDLGEQSLQLAIRYCAKPPVGQIASKLVEDLVFPVCSPQLGLVPNQQENLDNLAFLRDQMSDFTWEDWFKTAGPPATTIAFSHTANAVDAAISGHGVALGRLPLVVDDLASGRLVRPFSKVGESSYAYYLIRAPETEGKPDIDAVVKWLEAEALATSQVLGDTPLA